MRDLDRYFMFLGVLAALYGLGLGIWMGAQNNYQFMPLHAHANLFGWVTMALFALAYRTGLAQKDGWGAVHFWVSLAATLTFLPGIYIALARGNPKLTYIGAVLVAASFALFGINLWRAREAG